MPDSTLSGLRQIVASLERGPKPQADEKQSSFPHSWAPTGHPGIDQALGGGLAGGAVHELFAAAADSGPLRGAATAIAALATARASKTSGAKTGGASEPGTSAAASEPLVSGDGRPVVWIIQAMAAREAGMPYAPGFALMGLDPARIVLVSVADTPTLLSAACDAAASGAVAAIVAEAWGSPPALDLTATRRLTLAARGSGALVVLARLGAKPAPSAAETRWRVAAAPSLPLATRGANRSPARMPGLPVFDLTLLRHRRGVSGATWRVAWMCHERKFQPTTAVPVADTAACSPLSGGLAAASADRPAATDPRGRVLRLAG